MHVDIEFKNNSCDNTSQPHWVLHPNSCKFIKLCLDQVAFQQLVIYSTTNNSAIEFPVCFYRVENIFSNKNRDKSNTLKIAKSMNIMQ